MMLDDKHPRDCFCTEQCLSKWFWNLVGWSASGNQFSSIPPTHRERAMGSTRSTSFSLTTFLLSLKESLKALVGECAVHVEHHVDSTYTNRNFRSSFIPLTNQSCSCQVEIELKDFGRSVKLEIDVMMTKLSNNVIKSQTIWKHLQFSNSLGNLWMPTVEFLQTRLIEFCETSNANFNVQRAFNHSECFNSRQSWPK